MKERGHPLVATPNIPCLASQSEQKRRHQIVVFFFPRNSLALEKLFQIKTVKMLVQAVLQKCLFLLLHLPLEHAMIQPTGHQDERQRLAIVPFPRNSLVLGRALYLRKHYNWHLQC